MKYCLMLAALVIAVGFGQTSAGQDELPDGDFVRVEVRGKLAPWRFHILETDRSAITVRSKQGQRVIVLNLPDDATRKAA